MASHVGTRVSRRRASRTPRARRSSDSARVAPPAPVASPPRAAWRTAALVIVVTWALVFSAQLFAGRVFMLGDARVFRPFAEFSRARWHETHERTTWNPYVFAGIPATASLADPRPQYLPGALIDLYERCGSRAVARSPVRCS